MDPDGFAADLLSHYGVTDETVRDGFDCLVHDLYFAGPVRAHARHQAAVAPVWMYHFHERAADPVGRGPRGKRRPLGRRLKHWA